MKNTTDIYLAAAFLSLGAKLTDVDKDDPRHMIFEFEDANFNSEVLAKANTPSITYGSLDNVENEWANGTLLVVATKYADALRKLKSIVHSK
jgi:hypothetical protein